jgi:Domain of unknown function (DUF4136)
MKSMNLLIRTALLASPLLLSACVIPTGPVEVTRFNRAAEGMVYGDGSYAVIASAAAKTQDTLALSPYLAAVAREMQRIGYAEKVDGSDVVAEVAVDTARMDAVQQSPVSVGVGGSTGSYGSGVGVGVGINLGSLGGSGVRVVTTLRVRMIRRADNLVIWEGRASQSASAKSPAAQPGIAASKLAAALFQDFPGKSGETVSVP